jgi:DNA-binding transcriptional ArsR family regulator
MTTNDSAFPFGDSVETDPSPEMMSLSDAGDVMNALSTATARSLLDRVYETPATASELATSAETTLQNTQYHLTRLQAVGLVEVVGTWYSKKGREMAVYGAKNDPMVIFAGEADREAVISAWR